MTRRTGSSPRDGLADLEPAFDPGRAGASGPEPDDAELLAIGSAHLRASRDISERFFHDEADEVARACRAMAKRFHRGGRLLVLGSGGAASSDAYHVSVEFVHPVLVGKRALPALVVEGDPGVRIPVIGRTEDIVLAIDHGDPTPRTLAGLRAAGERNMLTIHLVGGARGATGPDVDHRLAIPSEDPLVVQEVQETLYHILWELVHVFFEHRGLL